MGGFRATLHRLWREAHCGSAQVGEPTENGQRGDGRRDEEEARVLLHARSDVSQRLKAEKETQRSEASLYARFVELHRRLSNQSAQLPVRHRRRHRRSSDGDLTTAVDEGESVVTCSEDDPSFARGSVDIVPSPERLQPVFEPDEYSIRLQVLHAVDAFRARFKSCTLGHLVMASFIVRTPLRITRQCLRRSVPIQSEEVRRATEEMAGLLDLETLDWTQRISLRVLQEDETDIKRVFELMWHDMQLITAVDRLLVRNNLRGRRRRALKSQMARLRVHGSTMIKIKKRSRAHLAALRSCASHLY